MGRCPRRSISGTISRFGGDVRICTGRTSVALRRFASDRNVSRSSFSRRYRRCTRNGIGRGLVIRKVVSTRKLSLSSGRDLRLRSGLMRRVNISDVTRLIKACKRSCMSRSIKLLEIRRFVVGGTDIDRGITGNSILTSSTSTTTRGTRRSDSRGMSSRSASSSKRSGSSMSRGLRRRLNARSISRDRWLTLCLPSG